MADRILNLPDIREMLSGLINFLGGKEQTEVPISLVIALSAIGAFIFDGIHVVRTGQAMKIKKPVRSNV